MYDTLKRLFPVAVLTETRTGKAFRTFSLNAVRPCIGPSDKKPSFMRVMAGRAGNRTFLAQRQDDVVLIFHLFDPG